MTREKIPLLLLRIGTAFAFAFPAIDALINPYSWLGYFPKFMIGFIPDEILLHSFGAVEICIALFILFGKNIFWSSLIASFILFGIIVFNLNNFEVIFRDVAILAMTSSLAITYSPKKKEILV